MRHLTRITVVCGTCGHTARRDLADTVACRGFRETSPERALCPKGHGALARVDGLRPDGWYHGVHGGHLVDLSSIGRRS